MDKNIIDMVNDFSKIEMVEGILLAGSHTNKTNDEYSDYDIYIYYSKELPFEERKCIIEKYFSYMELNNTFWETEDDGIFKITGIPVEIIYRDLSWVDSSLSRTLIKCEADVGYTTCFWSNFINSIILYDRSGKLNRLRTKFEIKYPTKLKNSIIEKNYKLLKCKSPSYYYQIDKALKRCDLISINHRVAALFASYFDIIFAINEFPHPGEKKILKIIKDNNFKMPRNMEENIKNILKYSSSINKDILFEIDDLINNLDELFVTEKIKIEGCLFNNIRTI